MGVFQPSTGMPGIGTEKLAKHRVTSADGWLTMLPGGGVADGTKMRDPDNPDYTADGAAAQRRLRGGLLIGQASGLWANSVIGVTNGALTSAGTTLTLASAQQGAELLRRVGATGTCKVTGPPTAAGTVRTLTATYSAIASTSVTITALGVNEVQTVSVDTIVSGGSVNLLATHSDGSQSNIEVAYNTSWTQTVADIQTALNAFLGASAVACAVTATKNMTVTFSGTGYAALPQTLLAADFSAATGPTTVRVTRTTAGVDGRFVTGSLVQPTDGSETPMSFLPGGWEMIVPEDSGNLPLDRIPIEGSVDFSQVLLPWPADASLKQWVRDSLRTAGGRFTDVSGY